MRHYHLITTATGELWEGYLKEQYARNAIAAYSNSLGEDPRQWSIVEVDACDDLCRFSNAEIVLRAAEAKADGYILVGIAD